MNDVYWNPDAGYPIFRIIVGVSRGIPGLMCNLFISPFGWLAGNPIMFYASMGYFILASVARDNYRRHRCCVKGTALLIIYSFTIVMKKVINWLPSL